MTQIEFAAKDVVFHFNKKNLQDPTIPMWIIKSRGQTYYIEHLEANLPFSTKETPDNDHTKGSIKFKNVHVTIDNDKTAHLRQATPEDMQVQKERDKAPIRVLVDDIIEAQEALRKHKISHDPVKIIHSACGEEFYVFELDKERDFSLLSMSLDSNIRLLSENEDLYLDYGRQRARENFRPLASFIKTAYSDIYKWISNEARLAQRQSRDL